MPLSPAPLAPTPDDTTPVPESVPLREAYRACEEILRRHDENFPVATRFLTPERRLTLAAIYAFARQADARADAAAPTVERLAALDTVERALLRALDGAPEGPVLTALADAVERHRLPTEPFLDLLQAFRMDARNATFATWDDLLGYCRGSANTIGRLVLATHGIEDPAVVRRSDDVCTALQLTNFWQDLGRDLARGRQFLPAEDLARFGLVPGVLTRPVSRPALTRLIEHECRATEELFARGASIVREVPLGLSLQLRATIAGGRGVLRAVERSGWRVLRRRPSLGGVARARILVRALMGLDG
jgi:squalene synthase HpnC